MMPKASRTVSSLALALGLLTMPVSTSASLSPIIVSPEAGQIRIDMNSDEQIRFQIFDLHGRALFDHIIKGSSPVIQMPRLQPQTMIWVIESRGMRYSGRFISRLPSIQIGHEISAPTEKHAQKENYSDDGSYEGGEQSLMKLATPPATAIEMRLMAIVTASDGTSGIKSDLYPSGFTRDSVAAAVKVLNATWAQGNVKFLFNPKCDIVEVNSSLLNEDVPIQSGSVVLPLPPKGVDDFTGNANVAAQRKFIDDLGNVVAVYFRDLNSGWYNYTEGGVTKNAVPGGAWSGIDHKYVRYAKSFYVPLWNRYATWGNLLAHETGHYFDLWHTFGPMYHNANEIRDTIKAKVDRGEFTKTTIVDLFNPDKFSGVYDTPADPGEVAMASVNTSGGKCGSVDSIRVPVTFKDGTSKTYVFKPNRMNIMSYYVECQTPATAEFSQQQVTRIRNTLASGGKRAPLFTPSTARATAVFAPYTGSERQSFLWQYDPHRKNYDAIWKQGWRLSQLRTHTLGSKQHYSATWRKSTSGEYQIYNATYSRYRTWYDTMWNQGYRLQNLSIAVVNGVPKYTAIVRQSTAGEYQIYGATYEQYRAWYDTKWTQGYRLFLFEPYLINGSVRYTAAVRKSTSAEFQVYNYTYSDYRAWYDQKWNEGYRLKYLKVLKVNSTPRYFAVVRPSTVKEYQVYNWTYEDFRKKYDSLSKSGWTLKSLNFY